MLVRMAKWECRPEVHEAAAELFENGALPVGSEFDVVRWGDFSRSEGYAC